MSSSFDPSELAAAYDRNGCVFPIMAMETPEVTRCRTLLELAEERTSQGPDEKAVFYGCSNFVLPCMDEITRLPKIITAVQSILGPNLLVWEASLLIKEAGAADFISWHQDLTYCGLSGESQITAWVALSAATVHSGCMRLVPGSYRRELVEHRDTFDEANMLSRGQEVAVNVNDADAVDVVIQPGEFSLHHGHIIHSSGATHLDDRRIGFAIRYITPEMKQVRGDKPYAHLVAGKDSSSNFLPASPPTGVMEHADISRAQHSMALKGPFFYEGFGECRSRRT